MDSPQKRIMSALANDNEKRFALIVNDAPVMMGGRQVYVKSQQSQLMTVVYKKDPRRVFRTEVQTNADSVWRALSNTTTFYGIDMSPCMSAPTAEFRVTINRAFGLLFVESPCYYTIKDCIRHSPDGSISNLNIRGVSGEFLENLRREWITVRSMFQVESMLRYSFLFRRVLKRKLNAKLYSGKNRMFRENIVQNKTNFLHLFVKTTGVYNPFLEDAHLTSPARNSWFFNMKDNHRMVLRSGPDYAVHCMTVNDFCRSIGLGVKIGFNSETAQMFLFGLLYQGTFDSLDVPSDQMRGFLVMDRDIDTGAIIDSFFTTEEVNKHHSMYDRQVLNVTGLSAFTIKYSSILSGGNLPENKVRDLLVEARIERR